MGCYVLVSAVRWPLDEIQYWYSSFLDPRRASVRASCCDTLGDASWSTDTCHLGRQDFSFFVGVVGIVAV